jgi:hypothetical protein
LFGSPPCQGLSQLNRCMQILWMDHIIFKENIFRNWRCHYKLISLYGSFIIKLFLQNTIWQHVNWMGARNVVMQMSPSIICFSSAPLLILFESYPLYLWYCPTNKCYEYVRKLLNGEIKLPKHKVELVLLCGLYGIAEVILYL